MERMKLATLLPNNVEDCAAHRPGRSVYPMQVTPFLVRTTLPGSVVSTLPPASAARSTVTDPGRIFSTISFLMSVGAGRPGINAVVTTMSHSSHCLAKSAISAAMNSGDISLAYPPSPSPDSSIETSKNSAPMDSTCSLAAARTSKARTMAPMFLAVWIAARPATPAPTTSTLAGGTLPAIVNWPAKNLGNAFAASTTAR
mmetsp:Transcript_6030/g.26641  ORF Transcript_6030/g.26641 Transcript_6030/m.26641 type:complete len:200 (+) Transcript_6030:3310-3909(+)